MKDEEIAKIKREIRQHILDISFLMKEMNSKQIKAIHRGDAERVIMVMSLEDSPNYGDIFINECEE